jgi:hypothetical protein
VDGQRADRKRQFIGRLRGLAQSVSMYEDRVVMSNPGPPGLDTKEARYEQIAEVTCILVYLTQP